MNPNKLIVIAPTSTGKMSAVETPNEVLHKADMVLGWDLGHREYVVLKDRSGTRTEGMRYNRHSLDSLLNDGPVPAPKRDIRKKDLKALLSRMYRLGWDAYQTGAPYMGGTATDKEFEEFLNSL